MMQYAQLVADYLVALPFPALLIVKSSLVLIVGAVIAILLHRSAASMRYAVWALALTAIVVLPFGMLATPPWGVPIAKAPSVENNQSTEPVVNISGDATTITNIIDSTAPETASIDLTSEQKLLLLWLAGSVLLLGRMVVARISLARLTRRSNPLDDADWTRMLHRESSRLGVQRHVRLFASDRVSTPLAAGVTEAFIILPSSASEWTDEHKEIVLRHELSHIARGDALVCVLSGIACAIYWFNPLVWIASRKLRAEQERACEREPRGCALCAKHRDVFVCVGRDGAPVTAGRKIARSSQQPSSQCTYTHTQCRSCHGSAVARSRRFGTSPDAR